MLKFYHNHFSFILRVFIQTSIWDIQQWSWHKGKILSVWTLKKVDSGPHQLLKLLNRYWIFFLEMKRRSILSLVSEKLYFLNCNEIDCETKVRIFCSCVAYFFNGHLQVISSTQDIKCCHCQRYISSDLRDLLEHCRLCPAMTRTDVLKHKYVCYACTYATYYNGNMKKHLRIHLGDRPFMCTLCNYSATRNTHLKLHMKTHLKNDLKHLIWQQ